MLQAAAITGQAPLALQAVPGVDVVQSGVNDFNVNARGFNSSLNRRVLVLQDGRDLAIAFLGSQEWNGLTQPLEDLGKVEMVRGPGSALYGANAFSGVLNITTPDGARGARHQADAARGGELETFRADVRHAGVLADGRFGYRVNGGYNRSDTWTRGPAPCSNGTSLQEEYADGHRRAGARSRWRRSRSTGQTVDPLAGDGLSATATRSRTSTAPAGWTTTSTTARCCRVDGGAAQVENEIFVTGIGRVQVDKAIKPYARAGAGAPTASTSSAYWNSRTSLEPQFSLASGLPIEERSDIFHVEGQNNWNFQRGRGRVVYGASLRNTKVNTSGTLMNPANDDRSDDLYSAYGQVEYRIAPQVAGGGRRAVRRRRPDRRPVLAQGRRSSSAPTRTTRSASRSTARSRRRTTRSSSSGCRSRRRARRPGPLEGGIEAYYAAVLQRPCARRSPGSTITGNLPWDFSPADPGAGAGQRRTSTWRR